MGEDKSHTIFAQFTHHVGQHEHREILEFVNDEKSFAAIWWDFRATKCGKPYR